METIGNITVGKAQVRPTLPSHTRGVREGNEGALTTREPGILRRDALSAQATPRRSTGINARARAPIDPRMPVLTPP